MTRRPWIRSTSGRWSCAGSSRSPARLTSGDFFSETALNNLTEHLLPGLWPFLIALIVTAIAVPFGIVLSRRYHVVAEPGGRHAHANPTPMLGGLAMWIGFAITMAVFAPRNLQTLGLLVVSGLATGLLIIDDRWSMRPFAKLAVQVALALLAVVGFNYPIRLVRPPGGHNLQIPPPFPAGGGGFWVGGLAKPGHFFGRPQGLCCRRG